VGTAIEFWKVTKAFDVSVTRTFPFISVKDKASYKDSRHNTNKIDADAMRYLSYALYPCVIGESCRRVGRVTVGLLVGLVGGVGCPTLMSRLIEPLPTANRLPPHPGYSIYALVYETHRSWYSWVLGSLVGAVYTFGFILMCPQLYLNYKLKSVAHLPWRQMTYKFLNTIIDDLFAFVIKMPVLHRLAVFRDDVVFMVFIYQRWIYRVDKTRVNEFGFSAEMEEEREKKRAAEAAAAAAAGGSAGQLTLEEAAAGGEEEEPVAVRRRKAAAGRSNGAAAPVAVAEDVDDDDDTPAAEETAKDK